MRISLRPDRLYARYTQITPQLLAREGVRLVLCDLDYTLAPKSVHRPDEAVRGWLEALEAAGITVMILSNNRSTRRVETFCRDLGIRYIGHAHKPRPAAYRRAMAEANAAPAETVMLGDKLLTDMLGANLSGCRAWMVEPLGGPVGAWNHVLHLLQKPFKALRREK